jgi:eukaryotic-like serine/threonine-protein kinase
LREDPINFGVLTRALQPARQHLIGPLLEVAKGHKQALQDKRYEAASVLAIYAADQAATLVDLLAESDERQFAMILSGERALPGQTLGLLREELARGAPWFRPLSYAERDALASRQANVALALLRLGQAESVWPLLKDSLDPTCRTYLTLRLAARGVEPRLLIDRLEQTTEVWERQALLSALGEYNGDQITQELLDRVVPRLLGWYRDDPDPGIHGAVDWLLRHGKEGPLARKLDWGQSAKLAAIDNGHAVSYRRRPLEREDQPTVGRRWSVNGKGMTFVHFPIPIEFLMGSPVWEPDRSDRETQHNRRIERSFALASRKVTVRDFEAFLKAHPQVFHAYEKKYSPDADCPITKITWYDAAQYCRWLSDAEGIPIEEMCYPSIEELEECKRNPLTPLKLPANHLSRKGYRLPTEAEWEYACRAGTTTAHYYGNGGEDLLGVYAWYLHNSREQTWPVGQKRPNDFGLYDMHGNAMDWCQESPWPYNVGLKGYALDEEDKRDVTHMLPRASRGCSFGDPASYLRSAFRGNPAPAARNVSFGFRVARTL